MNTTMCKDFNSLRPKYKKYKHADELIIYSQIS
jgi:hypothetical protein